VTHTELPVGCVVSRGFTIRNRGLVMFVVAPFHGRFSMHTLGRVVQMIAILLGEQGIVDV
jgi:hypothetical protein